MQGFVTSLMVWFVLFQSFFVTPTLLCFKIASLLASFCSVNTNTRAHTKIDTTSRFRYPHSHKHTVVIRLQLTSHLLLASSLLMHMLLAPLSLALVYRCSHCVDVCGGAHTTFPSHSLAVHVSRP